MLSSPSGKAISSMPDPQKVSPQKCLTEEGIFKLRKALHPQNMFSPILSNPSGSSTFFKELQPQNIAIFGFFKLAETLASSRFLQPSNTLPSSSSTESSVDNIGFAIPINSVTEIISDIIENGTKSDVSAQSGNDYRGGGYFGYGGFDRSPYSG